MKYRPEVKFLYGCITDDHLELLRDSLTNDPTLLFANTPFGSLLHVSASEGNYRICKYLLELGADVNNKSGMAGGNALNEAASKGPYEIVELLIDSGSALYASEPEQNPLFSAIYGCNLEVAKLLVERGIDFRVRYSGESMNEMDAVNFANERGVTDIRDYLIGLGSELRPGTRHPVINDEDASE
jgi:uncharacterized protein